MNPSTHQPLEDPTAHRASTADPRHHLLAGAQATPRRVEDGVQVAGLLLAAGGETKSTASNGTDSETNEVNIAMNTMRYT